MFFAVGKEHAREGGDEMGGVSTRDDAQSEVRKPEANDDDGGTADGNRGSRAARGGGDHGIGAEGGFREWPA